jgi:hypothetical protein
LLEPLNFILSVTEFDWIMRGVAPWYNLDGDSGDAARQATLEDGELYSYF